MVTSGAWKTTKCTTLRSNGRQNARYFRKMKDYVSVIEGKRWIGKMIKVEPMGESPGVSIKNNDCYA